MYVIWFMAVIDLYNYQLRRVYFTGKEMLYMLGEVLSRPGAKPTCPSIYI